MFSWTLHLNRAPRLFGQAAVAVGDKVYSFGGFSKDGDDQIDVHVFNTVPLHWRKLTPVTTFRAECILEVPSNRRYHTAVLMEDIYIWGGYKYDTNTYCNILYVFDVDTNGWFRPKVSGTVPEERVDHSACALGKAMFIHGGVSLQTGSTNDMYKLDTSTMVWSLINTRGTLPPASSCHSATIIGTKMFVFGGYGNHGEYNFRVFVTETNLCLSTSSAQPLPEGRYGHSAFAYNGELYIFGGRNENSTFNDMWKFNPETFSWKKVDPRGEGPSKMYSMCCCTVGDCIILFGGLDTPNDLHMLDLSPSLKMLCKLAVIQHDLDQSELTHDIRWELESMTNNSNK